MKKLLLLILLASFGTACKKSDSHASDAVITGYDLRNCACCGGLMINFNNDPQPYNSPFYLVRNMPANAGINEHTTFPVYASVIWQPVEEGCNNNIDILSFRRK